MKNVFNRWRTFLVEGDEGYFQETFDLFILCSIAKDLGANRDQVKNDIRAIPEVLTVINVEPPEGVQRILPTRYLITLKIHCRRPGTGTTAEEVSREVLKQIRRLPGVKVINYDVDTEGEDQPEVSPLEEGDEYDGTLPQYLKGHSRKKRRLIGKGGQSNTPPYDDAPSYERAKSAPPGAAEE